jgi:hypothetical protein
VSLEDAWVFFFHDKLRKALLKIRLPLSVIGQMLSMIYIMRVVTEMNTRVDEHPELPIRQALCLFAFILLIALAHPALSHAVPRVLITSPVSGLTYTTPTLSYTVTNVTGTVNVATMNNGEWNFDTNGNRLLDGGTVDAFRTV